jgi:pantoate--beta-alanine ligase
MAQVFKTISEWREFRKSEIFKGISLGFVPTMGALHDGHISLFNRSVKENDKSVASIFVNPTQFNDKEDLKNYPRNFDEDYRKLADAGVDYIIFPEYNDMYNDDFRYEVNEKELSKILCGASRPGHFTGVLTVVLKLLNIVKAGRAYFGEKDYQQYLLIKGMTEAFFIDTQIVPGAIVREADGLAMSSRNVLLND